MTKAKIVAGLSALAQETRLDILRLLVQRGSSGMPAGEIGGKLGLPSATLAFHLNQLRHVALVEARRHSRMVIYSAKFRTMKTIIEYLTDNCCTTQFENEAPRAIDAVSGENRLLNVLFLCTQNSARSIMAECAMNKWGQGRFRAFSAGSRPRGVVHPMTLRALRELKFETKGLRSKDWREFAVPAGPPLDFVFTLCDRAAAEVCPTWPGQPIRAHWGVQDPVAVVGTADGRRSAFAKAYAELEQRIRVFAALPVETLERFALEHWVAEIANLKLAA